MEKLDLEEVEEENARREHELHDVVEASCNK